MTHKRRSFVPILVLIAILTACATHKAHYAPDYQASTSQGDQPEHTIMFFGGADMSPSNNDGALPLLKKQLNESTNETLILLGNNGAKKGLPDSTGSAKRSKIESVLKNKLDLLKSVDGQVFLVPGNHDWNGGGKRGFERVLRLEDYVEEHLGDNVLVPNDGCPGPYEIVLKDGLVLLFLNTQWWLHEWDKPGPGTGCDMESSLDFIIQLEDAIKRHINKKVIVVAHHPIFSNGPHGGYSPASAHLFPPVLGSVYAWYRSRLGSRQDLADLRYRVMRKSLAKLFAQHPNLIYLSGHERSLQYHKVFQQHYVVSGSIAKATATAEGNNARYAEGTPGFGKLNFYTNGDVFLEFWTVDKDDQEKMSFREKILNHVYDPKSDEPKTYPDLDFTGQRMTTYATDKLEKNQKRPGLLGKNYRKEWRTEIKDIRVFDIGKDRGGLKIVQKGGGLQTKSLRLENAEGKQYVLRSIEKFPEKAVPAALRGTIASDLVSDQVSASHPYGAFAVPKLAEAAGVYHTNPELVYLPDDPRLGEYREDFANGLYLYEERPAKDRSDVASFGRSKKIINTADVLEKTMKDDEHYVDQTQVLRSRIFDIWIGDWDRHDDQWRWASFKDDDGFTFYRPVPRDRDQAFFWADGTLIKLISRRWGEPKFQGFHHEIRDVAGLEFNARYFDRSFLTEPDLDDWVKMAEEIKSKMTDELIESSVKDFPPEIYALHGEVIISKLKKRRDDLTKYAREFYLFLSKSVNVMGTNKAERFEVTRLNDEETLVQVFRVKEKSGKMKRQVYERKFKTSETDEIRLYGLGDNDRFNLRGEVKKGIKVRIIGGKGKDEITDSSKVAGPSKRTIFYDKKSKSSITSTGELKNKSTDKKSSINAYNRYEFKYDKAIPMLNGGFNPDDGLFIGGGVSIIKNGFRKEPFAARHTILASIAPRSSSYNFKYTGHFTQVFGKWDLLLEADIFEPSFADFFYGFGNRTAFDMDAREEDSQFYRARYGQWFTRTDIQRSFGKGIHTFKLGGFYRSVKIETDENDSEVNRFILSYPESVGRGAESDIPLLDNRRNYVGARLEYNLDLRDSRTFPTKGMAWNVSGKTVTQISDEENDYQSIASDASAYFSFGSAFKTTLAVRVGGQANFGDFEFYQAPRLGGLNNLRGYRRSRFAGDEIFYQNTDLRIKLLQYRTILFPGTLGITLIHDIGRTWTDQEDVALIDDSKEQWHRGYGGGLWIAPLGTAVISIDYTVSNDDETGIYVRFGFLF
ncbi:MAG: BamA/TamA family outer membrane protein [Bacteroidota bacterium]